MKYHLLYIFPNETKNIFFKLAHEKNMKLMQFFSEVQLSELIFFRIFTKQNGFDRPVEFSTGNDVTRSVYSKDDFMDGIPSFTFGKVFSKSIH